MSTNQQVFELVEGLIREEFPKFRWVNKRKSRLHRFIGWACRAPWFGSRRVNPLYMTHYYTTFSGKIAHPDSADLAADWPVFAHEWRHLKQERKWALFRPLYLLGLPFYAALGAVLTLILLPLWILVVPWWISLIVLGTGFALSCPVPFAYWRARWEFQAFAVSIALQYWLNGQVDQAYLDRRAQEFTGSNYFWMWPYRKSTLKRLDHARLRAISGAVFRDPETGEFMKKLYLGLRELGLTSVQYSGM